jgi:hypothetical protein
VGYASFTARGFSLDNTEAGYKTSPHAGETEEVLATPELVQQFVTDVLNAKNPEMINILVSEHVSCMYEPYRDLAKQHYDTRDGVIALATQLREEDGRPFTGKLLNTQTSDGGRGVRYGISLHREGALPTTHDLHVLLGVWDSKVITFYVSRYAGKDDVIETLEEHDRKTRERRAKLDKLRRAPEPDSPRVRIARAFVEAVINGNDEQLAESMCRHDAFGSYRPYKNDKEWNKFGPKGAIFLGRMMREREAPEDGTFTLRVDTDNPDNSFVSIFLLRLSNEDFLMSESKLTGLFTVKDDKIDSWSVSRYVAFADTDEEGSARRAEQYGNKPRATVQSALALAYRAVDYINREQDTSFAELCSDNADCLYVSTTAFQTPSGKPVRQSTRLLVVEGRIEDAHVGMQKMARLLRQRSGGNELILDFNEAGLTETIMSGNLTAAGEPIFMRTLFVGASEDGYITSINIFESHLQGGLTEWPTDGVVLSELQEEDSEEEAETEASSTTSSFCQSCGSDIKSIWAFCMACGQKVK